MQIQTLGSWVGNLVRNLLLLGALAVVMLSVQAVANITFSNRVITFGVNAPIYDTDGVTKLDGPGFVAQLYGGIRPDALEPLAGTAPFRAGPAAGYFNPGLNSSRTIEGTWAGDTAYFQIRVWEIALGATYDEAVAAGSKHGQSLVFGAIMGGRFEDNRFPTALPGVLKGLQSFALTVESRTIQAPPGFSLIANPLFRGANTVVEVLPSVPEGTILYRWDNRTKVYKVNVFDFGRWTDPGQSFPPGSGAFLLNPSDLTANITFIGRATAGERITSRAPGFHLIGCGHMESCHIAEHLSFPPVEGDTVYRMVGGKYSLSIFQFGNWQGFPPVMAPGESVFLQLAPP
jgi:hypothetical protein